MQLTPALPRPSPIAIQTIPAAGSRPVITPLRRSDNAEASAEIAAYIAIRDRAFAEAEVDPTEAKLERALQANEFVQSCLRPARTPYEAQYLSEPEAITARKRCEAVKAHITTLRR